MPQFAGTQSQVRRQVGKHRPRPGPQKIPGGVHVGPHAGVGDVFNQYPQGEVLAEGVGFVASAEVPLSDLRGVDAVVDTGGLAAEVDRSGIQPLGVSLDHIGPLTRTVGDAGIAFEAMVDGDRRLRPAPASCRSIRIGLPENFYFEHISSEVRDAVQKAAKAAERFGAQVTPVKMPDIDSLNDVGRVILLAEASAMYQPYFSRREDFGADVLALLDQGRLVPATDYVNAQRIRKMLVSEFFALFSTIDCLLTPATPTIAPLIGQKQVELDGEMMDTRLATTRLVRGINVLGFPALSMPCGKSGDGLPIGLQLIGRPFEEKTLLALAEALEREK